MSALNRLTDGTGVSSLNVQKVVKDFVADALLSAAAALGAAQIVAIPQTSGQTWIAAYAIGGAIIHAAYRAVLKWAQSPS